MTIQINTDRNINGNEKLEAYFISSTEEALARFSEHITRIELHLSDENGTKEGPNNKRCLLEARLAGRPPIAVTHQADTIEQAYKGSMSKLKAALETILGKLKEHQ